MPGSLTVIGTGYRIGGHITSESLAHLRIAEKVFANVDSVTYEWLSQINPATETLLDCYAEGKERRKTYRQMVHRILAQVRENRRVCAVFYGHPGVACDAGHEAVRQARREGFVARMLPGVSAEDCLIAELGIDPTHGCQHLEATDFLLSRYRLDVTRPVILWQIGVVGEDRFHSKTRLWNPGAFDLLVEKLLRTYPATHRVTVYETSAFPVCEPIVCKVRLARVAGVRITNSSTLFIPPLRKAEVDTRMLARLNSLLE
jgi:hypothetical protein